MRGVTAVCCVAVVVVALVCALGTGVAGQGCAGKHVVEVPGDGTVVTVSDGSLVNAEYLTNQECLFALRGPDGYTLAVEFTRFDTECAWDHVYVYDGSISSADLVGVFSGLTTPPPMSLSSSAVLLFVSDQAVAYTGWEARITAHPCPLNCSVMAHPCPLNCSVTDHPCPLNCSVTDPRLPPSAYSGAVGRGSGVCTAGGVCDCLGLAAGPACGSFHCGGNLTCSGHGVCGPQRSPGSARECECDPGYSGPSCATGPSLDPPAAPSWAPLLRVPPWQRGPLSRTQAVVDAVNASHVIVFGGTVLANRDYRADVLVFDPREPMGFDARPVATTGDAPPATGGAAGVFHAPSRTLFVFGGEIAENVYTNAVYALALGPDGTTGTWATVLAQAPTPTTTLPLPPLAAMSAALIQNTRVLLFGGYSADVGFSSRLAVFDIPSRTLSLAPAGSGSARPAARQAATLVALRGPTAESAVLYGGSTAQRNQLGDVWLLHGPTLTWTSLVGRIVPGANPVTRYHHAAVALDSQVMLVFGGRSTPSTGTRPVCFASDAWALDMTTFKWVELGSGAAPEPSASAAWPVSRYGHGVALAHGAVTLIGGFAEGMLVNDVWSWPVVDPLPAAVLESRARTPDVCASVSSCYTCGLYPACGWCEASSSCVLLDATAPDGTLCNTSDPGSPLAQPSGCVLGEPSCSALNGESCTECAAAPNCKWCSPIDGGCSPANAGCVGLTSPDMCPGPVSCASASECGPCTDIAGCSWCSLGGWTDGFCYPTGQANACPFPWPANAPGSSCPVRCESLSGSGCTACVTQLCMYCDSTDDCFSSNDYLMAYPYAECPDWHYGPGDCPVDCSSHSSCAACSAALDCGWCAETGTCMEGSAAGPYALSPSSATCEAAANWHFWECPCSNGPNAPIGCEACVAESGCAFCVDSATCLEAAYTPAFASNSSSGSNSTLFLPPSQCVAYDVGVCPDCSIHTDCGTCSSSPDCGWCLATSSCERGGVVAPPQCPVGWVAASGGCPNCTRAETCGACVAEPECGWCEGVGCVAGSSAYGGAYNTSLECSAFDGDVCAGHCAALAATSCTACAAAADPDCGWCCGSASCSPETNCPTAANGDFHQGACPDCTADDCTTCVGPSSPLSSCCGWCDSTATCSRGSSLEPDADEPMCPVGEWFGDACPVPCESLSTCSLCVGIGLSQCGWCQSSQSCHTATVLSVPTLDPPCALWAFGPSCPVPCVDVDTCGECALAPHCKWCESNQQCRYKYDLGVCPSDDWHSLTCPVDCGSATMCTDCLALDSCGWCVSAGTCMRGTADAATGVTSSNSCPSASWLGETCDQVCESRVSTVSPIEACFTCTADLSCGYCPLDTNENGVGGCVAGSSAGPSASSCGSYTYAGCPSVTQIIPGTVRSGVLSGGQSRLFFVQASNPARTLTLHITSEGSPITMYVSMQHYIPSATAGYEWIATGPGDIVIAPSDFTGNALPLGVYYTNLVCGYGGGGCAFRLTARMDTPSDPQPTSAFWIVYFVGVFFGAVFGVLLIAFLIKKLRDSLEVPTNLAMIQRGGGINRRVRPFVPFRVLVPGDQTVASPWFLIMPVGEDEPSVHAVVVGPGSRFKLGQVVQTAPGKKMVRVSNRRVVGTAPRTNESPMVLLATELVDCPVGPDADQMGDTAHMVSDPESGPAPEASGSADASFVGVAPLGGQDPWYEPQLSSDDPFARSPDPRESALFSTTWAELDDNDVGGGDHFTSDSNSRNSNNSRDSSSRGSGSHASIIVDVPEV